EGKINRGEHALMEEKPVRAEILTVIRTNNISEAVDTIRDGVKGAREINRGILLIFEGKAVRYSGRVEVISNNQSGNIYLAGMGLACTRIVNGLSRRGCRSKTKNISCCIIVNANDRIVVINPKHFGKSHPEAKNLLI